MTEFSSMTVPAGKKHMYSEVLTSTAFLKAHKKNCGLEQECMDYTESTKKEKSGKCLSAPVPPQESAAGKIRDFVEDGERNIWFGTFDGLHKYSTKTGQYSLIQIPKYVGGLNHPSIFSLCKDMQGTIWVGSYFGGVNYFTPKQDSFVHYDYDQKRHQKSILFIYRRYRSRQE